MQLVSPQREPLEWMGDLKSLTEWIGDDDSPIDISAWYDQLYGPPIVSDHYKRLELVARDDKVHIDIVPITEEEREIHYLTRDRAEFYVNGKIIPRS